MILYFMMQIKAKLKLNFIKTIILLLYIIKNKLYAAIFRFITKYFTKWC